jgi:hypothetical protein
MLYAIINDNVIREVREISQVEFDQGIVNKNQAIVDINDITILNYFSSSLLFLKNTINLFESLGYTTKAEIIAAIIAE